MKLYVNGKRGRIFLNIHADNRRHLAALVGAPTFLLLGESYHVNQVIAENGNNDTTAGLVIGGIVGIVAGPLGILVGGAIGGLLGNNNDSKESSKVAYFNNSTL